MPKLVLASTSSRRRELLKQLGRPFEVVAPEADESLPEGLSPAQAAEVLAARKAESVAARLDEGLVLGADTLVVADDRIIGKPRNRSHAIEILETLSRGPHHVITGVCLINARTGERRVISEDTRVIMRRMTHREVEAYVDSGEAMGKAGAYAIQQTGDRFVERVVGSFSNVVGLPMERVRRMIEEIEGRANAE